MYYATATDECPLPFSPFKSCTVPRPIGTRSRKCILDGAIAPALILLPRPRARTGAR